MKEIKKKALMWSLVLISVTAILVVAGEPSEKVSLARFLVPKAIALGVFAGCIFFGKYAQKKGMLPKGEKMFAED